MSDDKKPTNPIVAYAGLIAAIAGLISSITAYQKASQEQVARDSYKTTAAAIDRLSDESAMNHADLVALRQYLVDHITVAVPQGPPNPSAMAPDAVVLPPVIRERRRPVVVSKKGGGGEAEHVPLAGNPVTISNLKGGSTAAPAAAAPPPPAPARMPDEWPE